MVPCGIRVTWRQICSNLFWAEGIGYTLPHLLPASLYCDCCSVFTCQETARHTHRPTFSRRWPFSSAFYKYSEANCNNTFRKQLSASIKVFWFILWALAMTARRCSVCLCYKVRAEFVVSQLCAPFSRRRDHFSMNSWMMIIRLWPIYKRREGKSDASALKKRLPSFTKSPWLKLGTFPVRVSIYYRYFLTIFLKTDWPVVLTMLFSHMGISAHALYFIISCVNKLVILQVYSSTLVNIEITYINVTFIMFIYF